MLFYWSVGSFLGFFLEEYFSFGELAEEVKYAYIYIHIIDILILRDGVQLIYFNNNAEFF